MADTNVSPQTRGAFSGYAFIFVWTLVIILLFFVAKTKVGYTFLFFFTASSIIVVLAVGSQTIVKLFNEASFT